MKGPLTGILALALASTAQAKDGAETKPTNLGGGVWIDLPVDFETTSMKNPALEWSKQIKEAVNDAVEWRSTFRSMRFADSYIDFKNTNGSPGQSAEEQIASLREGVEAYYLPRSDIGALEFETVERDGFRLVYTTVPARAGEGFEVAGRGPYACATSASLIGTAKSGMVHSISIASKDCDSAEHQAALAAFLTFRNTKTVKAN